jgi:6-pyruvoyl-tetrahydropterin synthase
MKTMNIIINTRFSAIHFWPDCPIKEVAYLRNPHRHEFHVQVKAPVKHGDRDIEFIQLKNKIQLWISKNWDKQNLENKSCENMCSLLLFVFPELSYVRVLEDGENGAEIEKPK